REFVCIPTKIISMDAGRAIPSTVIAIISSIRVIPAWPRSERNLESRKAITKAPLAVLIAESSSDHHGSTPELFRWALLLPMPSSHPMDHSWRGTRQILIPGFEGKFLPTPHRGHREH